MRTTFLFLCCLLPYTNACAQATEQNWQLLIPQQYHDGEAPLNPGNGWLALLPVKSEWHLVASKVKVKRVTDPSLKKEEPKTGIEIKGENSDTLALLKAPYFKIGKITTPPMSFKNTERKLSNKAIDIKFKGAHYQLGVETSGVYLQFNKQKQTLSDLSTGRATPKTSLRWAGDLDGDGKLDFLFSIREVGRSGSCVFLSSIANKGQLIKKLSCHFSVVA